MSIPVPRYPESMPARHQQWPLGVLLLGIFCALGAGSWIHAHQRYKHFAVHEPGKVYRCAWVEPDVMAELVRKYHIRTVVNLCRPEELGRSRELEEQGAVIAAGGRTLFLPMPESANPRDTRLEPLKQLLKEPDNFPLLVHCQHGVNRTARFLAMYEVLVNGADGEAAVQAMPKFGRRRYAPLEYEFARNFTAAYR